MFEEIQKHQLLQKANILRGFGINSTEELDLEIFKYKETDFEKAKHQDGDMHPNGKWVWVASANGGKGDWRVYGGRTHSKSSSIVGNTTSSSKLHINQKNELKSSQNLSLFNKIKVFSKTNNEVFIASEPNDFGHYPVIQIHGNKSQVNKIISKLNKNCGTNFSIDDFKRNKQNEYSNNNYEAILNTHNNKLYKDTKDAEKDRPEAEDLTSKFKKYQTKFSDNFKSDLDYVLASHTIFGSPKYAYQHADQKIKVGTQNEKGEIWMPTHNDALRGRGDGFIGEWKTKDKIIKQAEILRINRGHYRLSSENKKKFIKGMKVKDFRGKEWTVTKIDPLIGKIRITRTLENGNKKHVYLPGDGDLNPNNIYW